MVKGFTIMQLEQMLCSFIPRLRLWLDYKYKGDYILIQTRN